MTNPPDYLTTHVDVSDEDLKHYGVKGMRWGVRRSSSQLRAAAKGRSSSSKKKTDDKPDVAPKSSGSVAKKETTGNIQDRVESSADRYSRLESQARAGRASDMTEADLKFFNARTEAISKVQKMYEEKPSWLSKTATEVVQSTAKNQMQSVSNALADKYIGAPIRKQILGSASGS